MHDFDFSGHMLDRVEIHECNYNWKSFIEVYLEDYHVVPFHPGLGQFVTCDDLRWEFAPWASLQTVGITSLGKAGTRTYERWHKAVLDYYRGEVPKHGAIWLTYYPNIMLEWYPHVLVISTLIPRGVDRTHQRRRVLLSRGHRAVRARVRRGRAGRVHGDRRRGRRDRRAHGRGPPRAVRQGRSEEGPYQSPMEDGMQHFHEFLRRELDAHIAPR